MADLGADVEHFDFTENGEMRNKSIDARADINMLLRVAKEDLLGDPEVLMEVVSRGDSIAVIAIGKTGVPRFDWKIGCILLEATAKLPVVA